MDLKIGDDSDDEIFFGPMKSLTEVRKAVMLCRRTMSPTTFSYEESDSDSSLKILETKSEPVLVSDASEESPLIHDHNYESPLRYKTPNSQKKKLPMLTRVQSSPADIFSPEIVTELISEESFVAMEKYVNETGTSPETDQSSSDDSVDLDNTFERIEYMLKKGEEERNKELKNEVNIKSDIKTPAHKVSQTKSERFNGFYYKQPTPHVKRDIKTPVFKTPVKTIPRLKGGSHLPFKTPPSLTNFQKSNACRFPNIVSPIGYCITNSPMVPQIQNVRPKKIMALPPLPNCSFDVPKTPKGKENVFLPPKAYKAAKETKLIDETQATGLPNNNQVKRMASALPQPKVIRHERREKMTPRNQPLSHIPKLKSEEKHSMQQVDDSFANLSVVSADVSVCVGKTAVRTDILKNRH